MRKITFKNSTSKNIIVNLVAIELKIIGMQLQSQRKSLSGCKIYIDRSVIKWLLTVLIQLKSLQNFLRIQ